MAVEAGSLTRWQVLLDRQEQYFGPIWRGRIGMVDQTVFASPPGTMLVWDIAGGRARAGEEPFECLQESGCDLLLVVVDAAGLKPDLLQPDPFAALRRLIRRGEVLFFVPAGREDLLARGFAELIEALGVPFLGTCH